MRATENTEADHQYYQTVRIKAPPNRLNKTVCRAFAMCLEHCTHLFNESWLSAPKHRHLAAPLQSCRVRINKKQTVAKGQSVSLCSFVSIIKYDNDGGDDAGVRGRGGFAAAWEFLVLTSRVLMIWDN